MATAMNAEQAWVPKDSFGARLALVRQAMGWNTKEAALADGVTVQHEESSGAYVIATCSGRL